MNQGVLDAIQQGKADLGDDPPASDQEAIPDSANHFLSKIAGIESQKPLYRVVLRVDTMPGPPVHTVRLSHKDALLL